MRGLIGLRGRRLIGILIRIIVAAAIGGASLWILRRLGFMNLRPIEVAFRQEWLWIGLTVSCLIGLLLVTAVRLSFLIRILGFQVHFRDVLAVNLIGQAVGQWLPGSLAMIEVVRFGMMAGWQTDASPIAGSPAVGLKARLGLALIVDRVLGLGSIFAAGGLAGIVLIILADIPSGFLAVAAPLSTLCLAFGFFALAAPFSPNWLPNRITSMWSAPHSALAPKGVLARSAWQIRRLLHTLQDMRAKRGQASRLILLSIVTSALNSLTLYFASRAAGVFLPFLAIFAAVPITLAAFLFPSGLAGFGGPQLLAAGVFRIFGVDPGSAVAACLLQNAVVLAVQTLGGAAGLIVSTRRPSIRRRLL